MSVTVGHGGLACDSESAGADSPRKLCRIPSPGLAGSESHRHGVWQTRTVAAVLELRDRNRYPGHDWPGRWERVISSIKLQV